MLQDAGGLEVFEPHRLHIHAQWARWRFREPLRPQDRRRTRENDACRAIWIHIRRLRMTEVLKLEKCVVSLCNVPALVYHQCYFRCYHASVLSPSKIPIIRLPEVIILP